MPKDNPALTIAALGGLKKPKGEPAEGGDEESEGDPDLKAEAKADIASAFESGDGTALADAMERLAKACMSEGY
jgi:hypothetical protein